MLARQFFWPGISGDVRRFCRNCDKPRASQVWRERKHGLLHSLPIPHRKWREISEDLITGLPESEGCTNLLVITDRLTRGVILEPMPSISTEATAHRFIRSFYRRHGLPTTIVSDRGSAFVSTVWSRACQLLNIKRLLSTAFHPETDGATKRYNAVIEAFLRVYCRFDQSDWCGLLPMCELALNNRVSRATGLSPFFLLHGHNLEPIQLTEPITIRPSSHSPVAAAEAITATLAEAQTYAETSLAATQAEYGKQTNRHRTPAPAYRPGDSVWLDLQNIRTNRPSKKLDSLKGKFTVIAPVVSHSYRLTTPPSTHNVFHTWLLRPASTDPLLIC